MVRAIYGAGEESTISFPPGIAVILPSLDPDERLTELISKLDSMGAKQLLIINDGSGKNSEPLFSKLERQFGVTILHHPVNRGKGTALKTGLRYLLTDMPGIIGCVTADADGQHTPEDIARVALCLKENTDHLILGSRNFADENVPWKSRMGNRITSAVFYLQTGRRCADTQTGLRGIPAPLIKEILEVPGERYEYEMNVLLYAADHGIPFINLPIQTVYINENKASHFRTVRDSALVYSGILKFGAASLLSAIFDIGLFSVLTGTVLRGQNNTALYAAIVARLCSGLFNYFLNKFAVFRQRGGMKASAAKYFLLFLCIMAFSAGTTQALSVLPVNLTMIKILVDTVLFFLSYTIQRKFIFAKINGASKKKGGR